MKDTNVRHFQSQSHMTRYGYQGGVKHFGGSIYCTDSNHNKHKFHILVVPSSLHIHIHIPFRSVHVRLLVKETKAKAK